MYYDESCLRSKIYVPVLATFSADGEITPLSITWEDGTVIEIDKVLDVRMAASLKGGGVGLRYLCRMRGQNRYIWLDENKWFVETKT